MSGIAGVITFDGEHVEPAHVQLMTAATPHRGPDGTRYWSGPGVVIAHQALHVTPQDRHDDQPREIGGFVCAADARIDNRSDLLPGLQRRGFLPDDTETVADSELILAAYRCWGLECPDRLEGDFAFVIWDGRASRLFAARDPMGMRALFIRNEPRHRVLFATEIAQLLAAPGVPVEIDELSVATSLAGPYRPADRTLYDGINELPAANAVTVEASGIRMWRHWRPDPANRLRVSDQEAGDAYRSALERAVHVRLRVSGGVGISLSGGIDSVSVASTIGQLERSGALDRVPLHAYSWGFDALRQADERGISERLLDHFPIEGHSVAGDDRWPLSDFPVQGPDRDDPFRWPYEALMDATREQARRDGVTILLTGSRGDEVTGDWAHDELGLFARGRFLQARTDIGVLAAQRKTTSARALVRSVVRPNLAHRLSMVAPERMARRRAARQGSRPAPWPPWVRDEFARRVALDDAIEESRRVPTFGGLGRSLRFGRVVSDQSARLAVLADRSAARHGLATADPFSDRRLIELILSLPAWQVQRRSRPKMLAREGMRGVVPEDVGRASHKSIPTSLFDRSFRERGVAAVNQLLAKPRAEANGWLDVEPLRSTCERYRTTGMAETDFWWPLTTEWWLRRWWSA